MATPPLPAQLRETAEYWQRAARGELVFQVCRACAAKQLYPRAVCAACLGDRLDWQVASGRGTVHAFSVVHRAPSPAFRERVPYVVALVDLEEGPRLLATVRGDPAAVRIGLPVAVAFEPLADGIALPVFELTGG